MNIFAIIVLTTMLIGFILDLTADLLNIRALKPDLPDEFRDVFDADKYKKSQEYTRVNTRFGKIAGTVSLLTTLIFWFAGGFNYVDQLSRGMGLGLIWSGLIFIGVLMLGNFFISLPFSIYSTFVIEEKFGFNKTRVKTFIADIVKGMLLSVILGGPILAGILWFFAQVWAVDWAVKNPVVSFKFCPGAEFNKRFQGRQYNL